jgi:Rha family phage regulatory protein
MNELVFKSEKGTPVTNSLLVAEKFGKEHRHVLDSIDELIKGVAGNSAALFYEATYIHPQNKQEYRMYIMNRDGFTLLAMGFTGAKALQFKLDFINAFNKMESIVQEGIKEISRKRLAQMVIEAEEEKEKLQLQVESQTKELKEAAPKVEYYDKALSSKGLLTANMIAACIGISHIKLNKFLCEWGIQYKQSDTYFLYHQYREKGYTEHKPHPYTDSQGNIKTRQHMYWTEEGKKFIVELYHKKSVAKRAKINLTE